MEGIPIVLEFAGTDEALERELQRLFNGLEEDVVVSHAFSGTGSLLVVTALGLKTLQKLIGAWEKIRIFTPKTTIKIGRSTLEIRGFTEEEAEALLASPAFGKAIRAMKR